MPRVCHPAALLTGAAKHAAAFAARHIYTLQGHQGCRSVPRGTPSPSAPAHRDSAPLHGLGCKASNHFPKPTLRGSRQAASLHEARQHAEQLPVVAAGTGAWLAIAAPGQPAAEGRVAPLCGSESPACCAEAREHRDRLGYPGQPSGEMQASEEPGSLTLAEPRRFDRGLGFNQGEVATSPGSTAASPTPAVPPAPSTSVAQGTGAADACTSQETAPSTARGN